MLTQTIVEQAFKPLITGDDSFLDDVANDAHWSVKGNDYAWVGTYTSKSDVASKHFAPIHVKLQNVLTAKTMSMLITGGVGDGGIHG